MLRSLRNLAGKKPALWTVGLALVLLVFLFLASRQVTPKAQSSVQVGLAAADEPAAIQVEGRLVPRSFVTLVAADGSQAAEVMVSKGQRVAAGDVLVQFEGYEQKAAEAAAAELELLLANQEFDTLYRNAGLELAQVELALAEASREQELAEDHLESLSRPIPQWQIEQAHANMLLADKQRVKAQEDLEKAQKRFANKKSIIWLFISQHKFKLQITLLQARVADYERRYQDAQENYEDLLAWPDDIDLALAQARLEQINANLHRLQTERDQLQNGPDADDLQLAQSRQKAAESRLAAAQAALTSSELRAPIDGVVAELNVKPGEWVPAGGQVAVLADFDQWLVQTEDLGESFVPSLLPGQSVRLNIDAIPELSSDGTVEKIDLLYTEDDDEIYYTAEISTDYNDPRLRWGMSVQVEIIQPQSSG